MCNQRKNSKRIGAKEFDQASQIITLKNNIQIIHRLFYAIRCRLSVVFLCMFTFSTSHHAQAELAHQAHLTKEITFFVQASYDSFGRPKQLDATFLKVIEYLESQSGLKFNIKQYPWRRAMMEVEMGHGFLFGASYTKTRAETLDFSLPMAEEKVWGLTLSKNTPLQKIQDLKGLKVQVLHGVSYGDVFEEAKLTIFEPIIELNRGEETFKNLLANKYQVILISTFKFTSAKEVETFVNEQVVPHYQNKLFENVKLTSSHWPLFSNPIHIVVKKGCYELEMKKINQAIEKGKKNGVLAKMMNQYERSFY